MKKTDMELSKSDIGEIEKLYLKKGKEWDWFEKKRKPTLSDFGISDDEYEKLTNPLYSKSTWKRYRVLRATNKVLDEVGVIFGFMPLIIPVLLFSTPYIYECIVAAFLTVIYFVVLLKVDKLRNKADKLYRNKEEYEKHLQLYEKWQVYKLMIEEKNRQKENRWLMKTSFFPYKELLTDAFNDISWNLDELYWSCLTPNEFEYNVAEMYEKSFGYETCVTSQSNDGGVDVVLRKNSESVYVQCKHYSPSNHLGVKELREFYGVCVADSVKGIMVCTSTLTVEAENFHNKIKKTIEIVGIDDLVKMSDGVRPYNDITPKLRHSFNNYLKEKKFLCFNHCYVWNECLKTKNEAEYRISQLKPYPDSDFCYKVMDIVDQEYLHYYIIAFVESKHSCLYNTFKIKFLLPDDKAL